MRRSALRPLALGTRMRDDGAPAPQRIGALMLACFMPDNEGAEENENGRDMPGHL
jgi:hypothetical protein